MTQSHSHTRRRFLTASVGLVTVTTAGCLDSLLPGENPPDPDTPPEELIPRSDEWTPDEANELYAALIGARDGVRAEYHKPEGNYSVEICRFRDEDQVEENFMSLYEGEWVHVVQRGVFGFAGNGPNPDSVREMLEASDGIDSIDN